MYSTWPRGPRTPMRWGKYSSQRNRAPRQGILVSSGLKRHGYSVLPEFSIARSRNLRITEKIRNCFDSPNQEGQTAAQSKNPILVLAFAWPTHTVGFGQAWPPCEFGVVGPFRKQIKKSYSRRKQLRNYCVPVRERNVNTSRGWNLATI